jgi:hypothetical protein
MSVPGVTYAILADLKRSSHSSVFSLRLRRRRFLFRYRSLSDFSINDSLALLLRFLSSFTRFCHFYTS